MGLGGTGSYILDYVSKTRVSEIHLFDGDAYQQHNAFRAPGATTPEELQRRPSKVELYAERYSKMRNGIVAHETDVTAEDADPLGNLDFVFVAIDDNETRQWLLPALEHMGVSFIDVGIGHREGGGQAAGSGQNELRGDAEKFRLASAVKGELGTSASTRGTCRSWS